MIYFSPLAEKLLHLVIIGERYNLIGIFLIELWHYPTSCADRVQNYQFVLLVVNGINQPSKWEEFQVSWGNIQSSKIKSQNI